MEYCYNGRVLQIADAHTHIYPEKIAAKATASIGSFYGLSMDTPGTSATLLASGAQIGVQHYLVCSVATKPEQSRVINDFIAEECAAHPEFIGFASLHPKQADWDEEITRALALGLRGVKLHPDFQHFNIDEPSMLPVYRRLAAEGLPVLFHMGDSRYDYSKPRRLATLLREVPTLCAIAAHFGGYEEWDAAERELGNTSALFDTSSSLWSLPRERAVELVHRYGATRMMFGSDFPMWGHAKELELFLSLGLTDAENEQILCGTFCKLFGLAF